MPNASMMCDARNHAKSFVNNNEFAFTNIANNIEIKTKNQKNINCKIKRMMKLLAFTFWSLQQL
jgi:predicted HAD superfamily Cof-like phosphohydrolase